MIQGRPLFLIIRREYLTRLKSKVFILSTILAPIAMILLLFLPVLLANWSGSRERLFLIYDETGIAGASMASIDSLRYRVVDEEPEILRQELLTGNLEGYLIIPHEILDGMGRAMFFQDGSVGMNTQQRIRSDLQRVISEIRLDRLDASTEVRDILSRSVALENLTVNEEGEEAHHSEFFVLLGLVMGFIIYGAMIGYGAIILRGVLEEKTSRIVEIMASSVRPFELLTGKVTGVALLGLTQFTLWALAGSAIMVAASPFLSRFAGQPVGSVNESAEGDFLTAIPEIEPIMWVGFVLFFLLGFLIYSSLFAAAGSTVDQESDSQQLQLPIITLIIIPVMFLFPVSDDPSSTLSVVMSMIPFFAPVLMPVRMAVIQVPFWQLVITLILMIATFLLLMWIAARIYRTGILMYGKKATLREIWRWVRHS